MEAIQHTGEAVAKWFTRISTFLFLTSLLTSDVRAQTKLFGWGRNDNGQVTIPSRASNVVVVATGLAHTLAVRQDGTVVAWGYDSLGQTSMPAGLSNVVSVAAMKDIAAVLITRGRTPSPEVIAEAEEEGLTILSTPLSTYKAAGKIWETGIR